MKLSNKVGKPVMDISGVDVEDDAMIVHAAVGGSLKMVIYLRPEDLYEARTLVMGPDNAGKVGGILRLYRRGKKLTKAAEKGERNGERRSTTPVA